MADADDDRKLWLAAQWDVELERRRAARQARRRQREAQAEQAQAEHRQRIARTRRPTPPLLGRTEQLTPTFDLRTVDVRELRIERL